MQQEFSVQNIRRNRQSCANNVKKDYVMWIPTGKTFKAVSTAKTAVFEKTYSEDDEKEGSIGTVPQEQPHFKYEKGRIGPRLLVIESRAL
jgi:hypothetical protein